MCVSHHTRLLEQWERACRGFPAPPPEVVGDGGALYHRSNELLLAREDKSCREQLSPQ